MTITTRRAAIAGIAAAATALGLGEIVAAFITPLSAPLSAVGDAVIAISPEGLDRWAKETFGTADKPLLLGGTLVLLGVFAAGIGILARRRLAYGMAGIVVFTAIGVLSAVTRPTAEALAALPSVMGGAGAAVLLYLLLELPAGQEPAAEDPRMFGRRRFMVTAGAAVAAAGVGGFAARTLGQGSMVEQARGEIKLPAPADPAPGLPASTKLKVKGITPWHTPNGDFYRIDTALTVPKLDPAQYRLRVYGRVERELDLSYQDILDMPLIERDITISCVSNEVGGPLVGNARWLGVRLSDILDKVKPHKGADQLVGRSSDGFTAGAPTELCRDGRDAMLAVGMNGEPLPVDHGFPVRMIVPGLYGYVSATKWLTELQLTSFDDFDAYWIPRGWSTPSPIKTTSRIDTPSSSAKAGTVTVAGVAWAQHRGIEAVEVRVDNEDWREAELAAEASTDVWRQWKWTWKDAEPGTHTLTVRAVDGDGETQTEKVAPVAPDGATGLHSVKVTVE
nr:molybdopterin-dependent oxidoreductase [Stackebrandtia nassauensis]